MRNTLKVLLVDNTRQRASGLHRALAKAGFEVSAAVECALELNERVASEQPDVIIIDTESPSRDVLEQLCVVSRDDPRPIVMFSGDRENGTIRAAVRAGVTAYIVDGLSQERIEPILKVAIERFQAEQELRQELREVKTQLASRKLIERAKGIIMEQRGVSEDEAFQVLRKLAMDRGIKLADAAGQVVEIARLLI